MDPCNLNSDHKEAQQPPDTKGEHLKSPGLGLETCDAYIQHASKAEEQFIERWNKEMDTLLIFAALFSAVLTAFVIESYHSLQPDSDDVTVQLLQQILTTLQSNHSLDGVSFTTTNTASQAFTPAPSAVRVNALWFSSLIISISTAFLAILAKQWLARLSKELSPAPETRVRQYQFRQDNIQRWRLPHILSSLPILLHISLLLFFGGLIEFLSPINTTVTIAAAILVAITVFVYVLTHTVSFIWATSPFKTTLALVLLTGLNAFLRELFTDLILIFDILVYPVQRSLLLLRLGRMDITDENILTEVLQERKMLRHIWSSAVQALRVSTQHQEDEYISQHLPELDARAVALMVRRTPQSESEIQLLGRELLRLDVVRNRAVLLEAGAISFLARQIRSVYTKKYCDLSPEVKDMVFGLSSSLACLLTEAEEDDAHTFFTIDRIPVHLDFLFKAFNSTDLTESGLCTANVALTDTDDILFFSSMLRLQLYASDDNWFSTDVARSVDEFQQRLQDNDEWIHLADDKLLVLINTSIHVSTREGDEGDFDGPTSNRSVAWMRRITGKRQARTLDMLAGLLSSRPDLHFRIQRQICWGIWICTYAYLYSQFGPLMTHLNRMGRLSAPLAKLMRPNQEYPLIPYTLLVLLEALLYSTSNPDDISPVEQEDKAQLINSLVAQYSVFLTEFRTDIPQFLESLHHTPHISPLEGRTIFIRLLKRIVSISGYLAFYASGDVLNHNPVQIGSRTIDLLLDLGKHVGDIPESDRQDFWRIAYGTAAQMTILQSRNESGTNKNTHDETGHDEQKVSRDGFAFDDFSPDMLADAIIAALRAASAAARPPFALKLLLLMIMLLPSHVQGDTSIDNSHSTILSRLRDADVRAAELIAPMLDFEGHRDVAKEALAAVQRNAEGALSMV